MSPAGTDHRRPAIAIEQLAAPPAWSAWLLPTGGFPDLTEDRVRRSQLLHSLASLVCARAHLKPEVVLQLWKLAGSPAEQPLNDNVHAWWPTLGLGIWPDREPPRGWNQELLSDAAAALFRQDEIALPSHKLLRIGADEPARINIARQLRGSGTVVETFCADSFDNLARRVREQFLPTITEKRFRRARFYLPVLDRTSLAAAHNAEQFGDWLCGIELYIRESAEDKGVLIVARQELTVLLEEALRNAEAAPAATIEQ